LGPARLWPEETMARLKFDLRGDAYRKVLGFLMGH